MWQLKSQIESSVSFSEKCCSPRTSQFSQVLKIKTESCVSFWTFGSRLRDLTATTSPSQNQPQLVSASCLHVNKHGVWSAECDTCDHTVNSICVCLSPLCNWLNLKYLQRFQLPKPNEIHNWARGTHTQLRERAFNLHTAELHKNSSTFDTKAECGVSVM